MPCPYKHQQQQKNASEQHLVGTRHAVSEKKHPQYQKLARHPNKTDTACRVPTNISNSKKHQHPNETDTARRVRKNSCKGNFTRTAPLNHTT